MLAASFLLFAQLGATNAPLLKQSSLSKPDSQRPLIEYSDWYERRLKIHRWGSYVELPLFALQVVAGEKHYKDSNVQWAETTHNVGAFAISALFASNTVTGVWNLWDSRKDPEGRKRRWIHALLMMTADAGFVYTATLGSDGPERDHRRAAYASMGVATVGTLYMWLSQ